MRKREHPCVLLKFHDGQRRLEERHRYESKTIPTEDRILDDRRYLVQMKKRKRRKRRTLEGAQEAGEGQQCSCFEHSVVERWKISMQFTELQECLAMGPWSHGAIWSDMEPG